MFKNSTDKINSIISKLEDTVQDLQLAEQESQIAIEKDDEKIKKLQMKMAIKISTVKKSAILRTNLSNLFKEA